MCIRLVERYAVCGCLYHQHAVDPCAAANMPGHPIRIREVKVGFACGRHANQGAPSGSSSSQYPDSGYSSGGFYSSSAFRGK